MHVQLSSLPAGPGSAFAALNPPMDPEKVLGTKLLLPGRRYTLLYPRHPFLSVPSPLEAHFIRVSSIDDLTQKEKQMDDAEFEANPLLLRSRFRINAVEVSTGAELVLFDEFMKEVHSIEADPIFQTEQLGSRPQADSERGSRPPVMPPSVDGETTFATLVIKCDPSYRPKSVKSVPSSKWLADSPLELKAGYGILFNGSEVAKLKGQWLCLATNGSLILLDVPPEDRPEDPSAFPPGAVTGLSFESAVQAQAEENADRLNLARVPRNWTIALRSLRIGVSME